MPPGPHLDTDERPFVLIWELTQACDLECDHCRAEAQPQRHPEELSTAEGKRLLDDAADFGDGQLVVLSGGDPLVRDDVVELVEYGTEQGLRMTMTPSGTSSLTRDRIAALHDAGLQRMAVSIDGGDAAAHDAFRGESGSFESTVEAARHAREVGLPLQVNTTVCESTVEQLPAIRDLVEELDAVLWSVFFLVQIGRGAVLDPVSPDRAERVMEWLCEVRDEASFGVKTTEAPFYRRVTIQRARAAADGGREPGDRQGGDDAPPSSGNGAGGPPTGAGSADGGRSGGGPPTGAGSNGGDTGSGGGPPADAGSNGDDTGSGGGPPTDGSGSIGRRTGITAGDGFAFVSHVGDVYPSGFLPQSAGNVREDSVVDIYRNADLFEALRDPDALEGKCGACEFREVCGGSRSRAFAETGDPLASDPLCPYVPDGYDGPLPDRRRETATGPEP